MISTKHFSALLLLILLAGGGMAQESTNSAKAGSHAAVEGIVVRDPDGQPVKKAVIELIAERQAEGGNYTAVTGPEGTFRIENVTPGRYHLFAERTGLLDIDKHHASRDGRILTLSAGEEVKDIRIRLQAAAVIRGRVTDEDGDPLLNAEVSVLRQTFSAGHSRWEQAAAERTNDLGEFRIANLAPGNVYVSVSPPPDFKSLIEGAGVPAAEQHGAEKTLEKASTAYQTTYYPGTAERSQASPIQLHAGDDFPVNFSLTPSPALSIRGSVVNLPPRSSATIMLQSHDFNFVMNGAEMHKDGSFVIRDVSPGSYTILASVDGSAVPLMAKQSLQVGSNNVEGLRLIPQPGASIRGRLRLETRGGVSAFDPAQIFLTLQPMDGDGDDMAAAGGRFSNLVHVAFDGSFEWKDVPPGEYYVQMMRESDATGDWFLKSIVAGGRDLRDSGLAVNGGSVTLDLIASNNGGTVNGVASDSKGVTVANAVIVAVPEARLRKRLDRYRKTISDQSGRFTLRGVPPGDYTLFAWESVDDDAYYNPDFLKSYEGQGIALRVGDGERKTLQLNVIPMADEQ